jgi:type III secretory pathway component EscS
MSENTSLVSAGAGIANRNRRYVVWFYLLNLAFAHFGATTFNDNAHAILDHSLHADKLLHGFNLGVFIEFLGRPEFGASPAATHPAMIFAVVFFLANLLFMPGVLLGYASDHRLPRDEFYRVCGRNVWRFVRLFLFFIVIAGIVAGILFGALNALVAAADKTSNERLPFFIQLLGTLIIFLVLTVIRIWFDLAQTEVVLRDQPAVRKSVAAGFRSTRRNLGRLLGSYVVIAIAALAVLVAGVWLWEAIVPPSSVLGAFIIGEATLLLLLAMRFWQRATAVAFYVSERAEPIIEEARSVPAFPAPAVP